MSKPAEPQKKLQTSVTEDPGFEIRDGVLRGMKSRNVEEVVVPEGIREVCIDGLVFGKLKHLIISEGVTEISRHSGGYRPGTVLETVHIPASVKKIEATAFDGHWRRLRKIDIAAGSPYEMQDGCLIDTRNKTLVFALPGRDKIIVPSSVKSIGSWSFNANDTMEIVIPEGIEKIERGAFDDCRSLTTISLPVSLAVIEKDAFSNCGKLSYVNVSSNNSRFTVRDGLLIDRSTKTLIRAFGSLVSVTIPSDVQIIGDTSFSFMTSLVSVTVPNTVRRIEHAAFSYCSNLEELHLPEKLDFYDDHFIMGCKQLREIKLPSGLKSIWGNFSFGKCSSLIELVFPEGLLSIGCNGLGAVCECTSLERIFIPASVSTIRSNSFGGAFNKNPSLKNIEVHPDNQAFCSKDGVLFSKDMTRLIRCPDMKHGIYKIPQSVQKIEASAFFKCTSLREIHIPKSVTEIGASAFAECPVLEKLEFENRAFKLDKQVFGRTRKGVDASTPKTNLENE